MSLLLYPPPVFTNLNDWPGLALYAATIFLEAEGETDEGKIAVAWVIRNRMDEYKKDIHGIILMPKQFSCWNEDYEGLRKARLTSPKDRIVFEAGIRKLLQDPTDGSCHYLNIELTKKTRKDGTLPSWAAKALLLDPGIKIGRHTFLNNVL